MDQESIGEALTEFVLKSKHKKIREGFDQKQYNRWRQEVFQAYKGKCFLTGLDDRARLQAHHLEAWNVAPSIRYEVSNGVLISAKVHLNFHHTYGNRTTTAAFEQFCKEKFAKIDYPWVSSKELIALIQTKIETQQSIFQNKCFS